MESEKRVEDVRITPLLWLTESEPILMAAALG